jgi:hypothetical protein
MQSKCTLVLFLTNSLQSGHHGEADEEQEEPKQARHADLE